MAITNPDEYRFRCPKGHVTIWKKNIIPKGRAKGVPSEPKYRCKTCGITYSGNPIDLMEVEE